MPPITWNLQRAPDHLSVPTSHSPYAFSSHLKLLAIPQMHILLRLLFFFFNPWTASSFPAPVHMVCMRTPPCPLLSVLQNSNGHFLCEGLPDPLEHSSPPLLPYSSARVLCGPPSCSEVMGLVWGLCLWSQVAWLQIAAPSQGCVILDKWTSLCLSFLICRLGVLLIMTIYICWEN